MQLITENAGLAPHPDATLDVASLPGSSGVVTHVGEAPAEVIPGPHAGQAGGANKFTDNGGAVLEICRLQLIYWGSAWAGSPTPSSAQVTSAVQQLLAGPYMTGLAQYRNIGRGHMLGSTVVSTSNPPNPFNDSEVGNFISV